MSGGFADLEDGQQGLGVFGGILSFGFVGIFVGPVLLALGLALARHWIEMNAEAEEESEVVT